MGTLAALLALLLGGCSALRVAYNTGPQLAWWWLDGYADFSREQAPQVKASIDRWFEWHRQTQLPGYAALLATAQPRIGEPLTPVAACQWNNRIADTLAPAVDRALEHAADVVPGLGEAQLRHMQQRYAKNIDEMRGEYLQADPAERLAASVKRTLTRAEQIYGRLDDAQRKVIAEGVAASPFDPQGWMEERKRRQRDTLATLRRLLAERADRDQRVAALRALAERSQRSPDPAYRAYQQRLTDYNCAFVARLHNATTTVQRQRARDNLKEWEEDLRAVINGAGVATGAGDPAAASN
ncbi:MAG: hypothetical protein HZC37_29355 [Burkholderiales bacterium]|nr:hypothetical protein [Burkholderiales bacterium]